MFIRPGPGILRAGPADWKGSGNPAEKKKKKGFDVIGAGRTIRIA